MLGRERTAGQVPSGRTRGVTVAAVGLLLFVWPFVRDPPLDLLGSYLYLLCAWVLVIAATWATSRGLASRGADDG